MSAAEEIIEVCRCLYERGMLAAADGNVSYRASDDRIIITPSGQHKAFLEPHEMAEMDISGRTLKGQPSSERLMHLEIYRQCPLARCVVHAHPPMATAWTIAKPHLDKLPAGAMPEVTLAVGEIPIIPYARPGTEEMGRNLRKFLPRQRVMILSRHGAVTWGESVIEAYNGMERLEHAAQILHLAHSLGRLSSLPFDEMEALRAMRAKRGDRTL
ncbi:MAG: aldolase [Bdellovibrionales bacterium RIFOXYD1_FULL_53_11]|nr:MAG: aldolase [Bdellovibrionales bacterium RIFOXYD1_FULL_53_11]